MNNGFRKIGFFLLLILGIASAFAQSGGYRPGAYVFYTQEAAPQQDNGGMQGLDQKQRQADHGRIREFDSSGFGMQEDNSAGNGADAPRRQGKLSPEQRRALRRQIDEAGHDIYSRRR